jgi:hypothetical protein
MSTQFTFRAVKKLQKQFLTLLNNKYINTKMVFASWHKHKPSLPLTLTSCVDYKASINIRTRTWYTTYCHDVVLVNFNSHAVISLKAAMLGLHHPQLPRCIIITSSLHFFPGIISAVNAVWRKQQVVASELTSENGFIVSACY